MAHHARRAKIKLDDFKFMLRRDTTKLGRVSEMLERDKDLKRQRKAFDTDEGAVAKDAEEVKGDGEDGDGGRPSKKARSEAGSKLGGKSADGEGKKKRKNKKNKKGDGDEGSERG